MRFRARAPSIPATRKALATADRQTRATAIALVAAAMSHLACAAGTKGAPPPPFECGHARAGTLTLAVDEEPILQSSVAASFGDRTIGPDAAHCTETTVGGGSCILTVCEQIEIPTPNGCTEETRVSAAGPIAVTGGTQPPVTLTSDARRSYPTVTAAGARWSSGDTVNVHAPGGEVPALDATLSFPGRVIAKAPAAFVEKRDPMEVDWKAGIVLTWTPGAGTAWIHLIQGDRGLRRRADIDCRVPSSAGTVTIPSEALQYLEATAAKKVANAWLDVAGLAEVVRDVPPYRVVVRAVVREERRNLRVGVDGVPPH